MARMYQHMTQRYRNQEVVDSLLTKCYHLSPLRDVQGTVKHKHAVREREREREHDVVNRLTLVTTGRKRVKADTKNTICI